MAEYIDRQAAIDEMQEYWRTLNLRRKRIPLAAEAVYMDLKGVVATLPSADVVEVLRCKDCKWVEDDGFCRLHWGKLKMDDFCSYGERKDG